MSVGEKELTGDVVERLQWRYATKRFDATKKIPDETWKKIERSLILTPSSYGLQPWKFVVITDPAVKEKLPALSWNQKQPVECSHMVVICRLANLSLADVDRYILHMSEVRGQTPDNFKMLKDMLTNFLTSSSEELLKSWMEKQCYIALGNLMTAASMYGVDNCPMEGFQPAEYDQLLDLPGKGCVSVVACALGYRADDDKYAKMTKVRFADKQVVIRI